MIDLTWSPPKFFPGLWGHRVNTTVLLSTGLKPLYLPSLNHSLLIVVLYFNLWSFIVGCITSRFCGCLLYFFPFSGHVSYLNNHKRSFFFPQWFTVHPINVYPHSFSWCVSPLVQSNNLFNLLMVLEHPYSSLIEFVFSSLSNVSVNPLPF